VNQARPCGGKLLPLLFRVVLTKLLLPVLFSYHAGSRASGIGWKSINE